MVVDVSARSEEAVGDADEDELVLLGVDDVEEVFEADEEEEDDDDDDAGALSLSGSSSRPVI